LLQIAAGLTAASTGSLRVLGTDVAAHGESTRARIGYLDQDRPLYTAFRVSDMLHFGQSSNPSWNMDIAKAHLSRLNIPLSSRVTHLSGGQQAQVALTVCLAKQPELLLLDEPAAALDPVAREDLLRLLMRQVAESGATVILSTHSLSDVAAICDYVVVLAHGRVVVSNDIEFLQESHRIIAAERTEGFTLPKGSTVIEQRDSTRVTSALVRMELPFADDKWEISQPSLEEIVMAYLRTGAPQTPSENMRLRGESPS
jgi:ABC-2 type transport system ATP-binding protein